MDTFKRLTLDDIPAIRPYFAASRLRLCDYSVGCAVMWRDYYDIYFRIDQGALLLASPYQGVENFYLPLGDEAAGLAMLEAHCAAKGAPLLLCVVPEEKRGPLSARYPQARWRANRDWADYLYESRDLIELRGKKYHAQRNHIHRFVKENPDYSFDDIQPADLGPLREFLDHYCVMHHKEAASAAAEADAVREVLAHYAEYGMQGGVLRAGGRIAGFSIGEAVGDTMHVHIEKADLRFDGVYQMLVNCFAKRFAAGLRYINREDDMGDPGLRKSKLAYQPVAILDKYLAEITL